MTGIESPIGRPSNSKRPSTGWWLAGAIVLATVGLLALGHWLVPDPGALVERLEGWIDSLGMIAPVAFAVGYIVAALLLVPGSVLTIAAGGLFGLWIGTLVVSLASTTAAALALFLARTLARDRLARRFSDEPRFQALDRAIEDEGWRAVVLLRLSPVIPFNLQNYLYGLTRIRALTCILASWLAMLPGTFLYVFIGTVGRAGLEAATGDAARIGTGKWVLLGVGLLATIAITVLLTRRAREHLQERTELGEEAT